MCQIIVKYADKSLDINKLDRAQKWNSDGYGVSWWSEEDGLQTLKTMDYAFFKSFLKTIDNKLAVVHLRNTTKGTTCVANNHPFELKYGVMFHNGTIYGLDSSKVGGSDTQGLAELINACTYEYISDLYPLIQHIIGDTINRLVFLDTDGTVDIMNEELGMWEKGIWYSNDYHKRKGTRVSKLNNNVPSTHLQTSPTSEYTLNTTTGKWEKRDEMKVKVFVYGTLKKGYYNNERLLSDATFLGKATTVGKWAMIGKQMGFPYVLERDSDNGHYIKGEVYEVSMDELEALDTLEGSPIHYHKRDTTVKLENGETAKCIMYVKTSVTHTDRAKEYIDEFTKG